MTDLPEESSPQGQSDQSLAFPSLPSPITLDRRCEAHRHRAFGLVVLALVLGVGLLTLGFWGWQLSRPGNPHQARVTAEVGGMT
jgi:hypothetical protein